MTRRGLSLLEVVIAALVMAIGVLSLFQVMNTSNQVQMDAYYELLAFQLAKEPIEAFQALGYAWIAAGASIPEDNPYPLDRPQSLRELRLRHPTRYPPEVDQFERVISVTPLDRESPSAFKVEVTIQAIEEDRLQRWLKRNPIRIEGLVFERPNEVSNR